MKIKLFTLTIASSEQDSNCNSHSHQPWMVTALSGHTAASFCLQLSNRVHGIVTRTAVQTCKNGHAKISGPAAGSFKGNTCSGEAKRLSGEGRATHLPPADSCPRLGHSGLRARGGQHFSSCCSLIQCWTIPGATLTVALLNFVKIRPRMQNNDRKLDFFLFQRYSRNI